MRWVNGICWSCFFTIIILGTIVIHSRFPLSEYLESHTSIAYASNHPVVEENLSSIITKIKAYSDKEHPDDSLIEIEPNLWVKESNFSGIVIAETRYYYHISPDMSFDPVARRDVSADEVTIIHQEEENGILLVIYTID